MFISRISIQKLNFTYEGFYEPVFTDFSCELESSWKLGLVGRNGMGKTTLLRLLNGELPYDGQIYSDLTFDYFPFTIASDETALAALREVVAPFAAMEAEMSACLERASFDAAALERYGELQHQYQDENGYIIDELITAEIGRLGVAPEVLTRSWELLSGGERTKLLLAALFLKRDNFLLIDEPTDHLDLEGRSAVAEYLSSKSGFIVVSHDRHFLDAIVDHLLVLEKNRVTVRQGSFSAYLQDKQREDAFELEQNERLAQQVASLERSSKQKATWSDRVEATKIGHGAADRGYIGHKAAKMMQLAKNLERRQQAALEEKRALLKHIDYAPELRIRTLPFYRRVLIEAEELTLSYGSAAPLFAPLTFSVAQGERVVLRGVNGSGKSSLFKAILGELPARSGRLYLPNGLVISHLAQETAHLSGDLRSFAQSQGIDESLFKAILRKLDFLRRDFERDISEYSQGEKKKVLLAASLCSPSHLYLWDEPLNFIDYYSREQISQLITEHQPTLLFVEHDRFFSEEIATKEVRLNRFS